MYLEIYEKNAKILYCFTAWIELNKDYGNERLGESIMNIDDFTPSKIANFFADPDTYSNVLEEVSRFYIP